jgi:hypothetical protein
MADYNRRTRPTVLHHRDRVTLKGDTYVVEPCFLSNPRGDNGEIFNKLGIKRFKFALAEQFYGDRSNTHPRQQWPEYKDQREPPAGLVDLVNLLLDIEEGKKFLVNKGVLPEHRQLVNIIDSFAEYSRATAELISALIGTDLATPIRDKQFEIVEVTHGAV